jgi:hypothetical protein
MNTTKRDTEATDSCMTPRVVRQNNMVMSPAEPRNKNDYAGEGQQQLSLPTRAVVSHETEKYGSLVLWDPIPRMTVLARTSSNLTDRTMPSCCGQEPLSMEAVRRFLITGSCYQATHIWRHSRLERLGMCYSYLQIVQNRESAVIICSHK